MKNMRLKKFIAPSYKGRLLLFAKDTFIPGSRKNTWSFLDDTRMKELKLEVEVTPVSMMLSYAKLTDDDVNKIKRKSGYLLEFYQFNELRKLSLSDETRTIFSSNEKELKELLSS